jgi:hypothetical protein
VTYADILTELELIGSRQAELRQIQPSAADAQAVEQELALYSRRLVELQHALAALRASPAQPAPSAAMPPPRVQAPAGILGSRPAAPLPAQSTTTTPAREPRVGTVLVRQPQPGRSAFPSVINPQAVPTGPDPMQVAEQTKALTSREAVASGEYAAHRERLLADARGQSDPIARTTRYDRDMGAAMAEAGYPPPTQSFHDQVRAVTSPEGIRSGRYAEQREQLLARVRQQGGMPQGSFAFSSTSRIPAARPSTLTHAKGHPQVGPMSPQLAAKLVRNGKRIG